MLRWSERDHHRRGRGQEVCPGWEWVVQVASEVICDDFRAWVGLRAGSLGASVRTGAKMLP